MLSVEKVLSRCAEFSRTRSFRRGQCLKVVRLVYGLNYPVDWPEKDRNAASAWRRNGDKHSGSSPPVGAALFWLGGSQGYGHIAISAGIINGKLHVWSTDLKRSGRFDLIPFDLVAKKWRLPYAGWSTQLLDQPVLPRLLQPASRHEWVIISEGGVVVRGSEGMALAQGVNSARFIPKRNVSFVGTWRQVK